MFCKSSRLFVTVMCALLGVGSASANVLTNPSFEAGTDGQAGAPGWSHFNDVYTEDEHGAHSGAFALKMFGPWFNGGGAGVTQDVAATAGETWTASAWAFTPTGDSVGVGNFAFVALEFYDASNTQLARFASPNFDQSAPLDTWVQLSATGLAPVGTTSARIALVHVQLDPIDGGAVFFDDASLAVPEPASMALLAAAAGTVLLRRRS